MICFATGDRIFSREFMEPLKDMGIREVLGAPRVLVRKNKNRRYAAFFARPVCSQNRIGTDPIFLVTRFPLRVEALGRLLSSTFYQDGRSRPTTEIDRPIRPLIRYAAQSAAIFNTD
jgi:hypothetical protein